MSPGERHFGKREKAAVSAAVATALGAISVFWAHRHAKNEKMRNPKPFRPEILNDERLGPKRLKNINDTAALLLFSKWPDRNRILHELGLTRAEANNSLGYLMDNGLFYRTEQSAALGGIPRHYVPAKPWEVLLPEILEHTDAGREYPYLIQSIEDRVLRRTNGNS